MPHDPSEFELLATVEHQRDVLQEDYERAMHRVAQLEMVSEALVQALTPFADAWTLRKPRDTSSAMALTRRMERALEGFYTARDSASDSEARLTGQHLKDAYDVCQKFQEHIATF